MLRENFANFVIEAVLNGQLFHHALAPVAQLPVLEIVSGVHIVSDLTLGLGTVIHDYLS